MSKIIKLVIAIVVVMYFMWMGVVVVYPYEGTWVQRLWQKAKKQYVASDVK